MTQTSLPNGSLMSEVEVSSMAEHVNTKKKKTLNQLNLQELCPHHVEEAKNKNKKTPLRHRSPASLTREPVSTQKKNTLNQLNLREPCLRRVREAKNKNKKTPLEHQSPASLTSINAQHMLDTNTLPKMACWCNLG